ncbi:MAG: rane protein, partial [Geobacteraceae bacterium]|nr:rane protein [Geobacteraceae bacterium]
LGIVSLLTSGCAMETKTQKGAAIGTGVGAAVGAGLGQAIGRNTSATLIGAAAGAVAGGLTGGAIGSYMDKQEATMRQELANVEGASVQRNMDMLAVTFKSDVLFPYDSYSLKPGSYDELGRVAKVLNQYPQTNITVAGHTDDKGSEEYNQTLSEKRADVVKNALAGMGVNPSRMTAVGHGESKPVADNTTEVGRQLNRRVEIVINPQQ